MIFDTKRAATKHINAMSYITPYNPLCHTGRDRLEGCFGSPCYPAGKIYVSDSMTEEQLLAIGDGELLKEGIERKADGSLWCGYCEWAVPNGKFQMHLWAEGKEGKGHAKNKEFPAVTQ